MSQARGDLQQPAARDRRARGGCRVSVSDGLGGVMPPWVPNVPRFRGSRVRVPGGVPRFEFRSNIGVLRTTEPWNGGNIGTRFPHKPPPANGYNPGLWRSAWS